MINFTGKMNKPFYLMRRARMGYIRRVHLW